MPESTHAERPRVLVVDDDLGLAETIADGLNERGFAAVASESSREAATLLASGAFDALVTDLRMPHMDGLELLELSRRQAPERPVLVMTAYGALESIESKRWGVFHYLTKPFKLDELITFMKRALGDARLGRDITPSDLDTDGHD